MTIFSLHSRSLHLILLSFATTAMAWGWGGTAHRFINRNAVQHLPPSMAALASQQSFLESHASDADNRKSADTAESPKHYIDLEIYPDYRHLPGSISPLIMQYGWTTVKEVGILPWATVWAFDSLTAQFRRGDLSRAYQTAADLGHYVGDAHQPLHCTVNYDGVRTGNNGIHSRYETSMINTYQSSLSITRDSVRYVTDPFAFVMQYTLRSHDYVDSILQADNAAKAASGWNGTGSAPQAYYTALWEGTRAFTSTLLQRSTTALASLWYTAWMNATQSLPLAVQTQHGRPGLFTLEQNYPNPFNPATVIKYTIAGTGGQGLGVSSVKLVMYDLLGKEAKTLVDESQPAGTYEVRFDATGLPSGVYIYRLTAGEFVASRRCVLLK